MYINIEKREVILTFPLILPYYSCIKFLRGNTIILCNYEVLRKYIE